MVTDAGSHRIVGNRYRLDEVAGSGGAGTVWRGFDLRLEREVAVKELGWAAAEDNQVRRRALREARTAARLPTPGVIPVFDVVEEPERIFVVMEFIHAPSLAALVRDRGTLTEAESARIGARVLDTLSVAHAAGIVHRDVKPSNVLAADDHVWLADFGIVQVAGDPELTATGIVLGSPAFIAPEQARGGPVASWTDLYGLGATLYFCLEGHAPFRGDGTLPTVLSVLNDDPLPGTHPGPLSDLIAKLMAKDPQQRPALEQARAALTHLTGDPDETAPRAEPAATDHVVDLRTPTPADEEAPLESSRASGRTRGVLGILALAAIALVGFAIAAVNREARVADGLVLDAATSAPSPTAAQPSAAAPAPVDSTPPPSEPPSDDALSWATFSPPNAPYALTYPSGWEVVDQGDGRTDIRDPQTGTFLRVEWSRTIAPPLDWFQGLSNDLADRRATYQQLQLRETAFGQNPAALWEYSYESGSGIRRAYNLGINHQDQYTIAVNLQVPADQWEQTQPVWNEIIDSLELRSLTT